MLLSSCSGTGAIDNASALDAPLRDNEEPAIEGPPTVEGYPITSSFPYDDAIEWDYMAAYVSANVASLRKRGSLSSHRLAKLPKGTGLHVLEVRRNGWCYVETPEGMRGYVWGPLLDIDGRKFITASYRGMTHILISSRHFLGPDGKRRSKLTMRGLDMRAPLKSLHVTSRYGIRKRHPVNGGRNRMHQGVDLRADIGTPVRSSAQGVVKRVVHDKHYGIYVDVKHPLGITTRYAHLSKAMVKKGQRVRANKVIGKSGNTGATTGPHLHFEIHSKGRAMKPSSYIRGL